MTFNVLKCDKCGKLARRLYNGLPGVKTSPETSYWVCQDCYRVLVGTEPEEMK